ncbi:MAG: type II toxin-antitoxin system Phd/YefM family antitoxin [Opitutales bacterium]
MKTVGAFEAKTHLAQLLDAVEQGEVVTITRRGRVVAQLAQPMQRELGQHRFAQRAKELRQRFKPGRETVRDLIEDGRRR